MASSVTIALFGVLCLILLQNQVYSKPAVLDEKTDTDPVPNDQLQGDQPSLPQSQSQQQAVKPIDNTTPPQSQSESHPAQTESHPAQTESSSVKEPRKEPSSSSAPPAKEAKPSAQAAGEKKDGKDGKGGSAVAVANYGLLLIGACLLMRL